MGGCRSCILHFPGLSGWEDAVACIQFFTCRAWGCCWPSPPGRSAGCLAGGLRGWGEGQGVGGGEQYVQVAGWEETILLPGVCSWEADAGKGHGAEQGGWALICSCTWYLVQPALVAGGTDVGTADSGGVVATLYTADAAYVRLHEGGCSFGADGMRDLSYTAAVAAYGW